MFFARYYTTFWSYQLLLKVTKFHNYSSSTPVVILTNTGTMLTANIDDACQGQKLVYTCVLRGTSQRWTISISAEHSPLVKTFWSDSSPQTMQIHHSNHYFNFTLISTDYHSFSSMLSTIAVDSLHNTQIECASVASSFTMYIMLITGTYYLWSLQYYNNTYTIDLACVRVITQDIMILYRHTAPIIKLMHTDYYY